jgi:hypothetical protein
MGAVTITVDSTESFKKRVKAAFVKACPTPAR